MDYGVVPGDSEHLAGPSPWGSSSPKTNRTSFPNSSDVPQSPTLAPQERYAQPQDSPRTPRYPDASNNGTSYPEDGYSSPHFAGKTAVPQALEASLAESQPAALQPSNVAHQPRQAPTRYQGARQQRPIPQYKLQAKVTALERSGRKDPVLRFDVHV